MADTTEVVEMIDPVTGEIIDQKQLAEQLLAQAKAQGMSLVGPGGLLSGLTKQVLETEASEIPAASFPVRKDAGYAEEVHRRGEGSGGQDGARAAVGVSDVACHV